MDSETSSDRTDALLICTDSQCCQRSVHYRCTKLPAYQIHVIKSRRNYGFYCENCVTVPQDLLELVPKRQRSQPSLKTSKEIDRLKREVDACVGLIKNHQNNEERLEGIIDSHKAELTDLKKNLQTNPAFHTLEYVENKFNRELKNFHESIVAAIHNECASFKSYAEAAKSGEPVAVDPILNTNNSDALMKVIKNARKEEVAEVMDKQKRSGNIIIHGVAEYNTDSNTNDQKWANDLIDDLRARVNIKRVSRIGALCEEKKRPLIVTLTSEEEKINLLGNLPALKGLQRYKGISITEDLTPEERKCFKNLSNVARERNLGNEASSSYTWRVRGNSKNGFYLKKINNANTALQPQQNQ